MTRFVDKLPSKRNLLIVPFLANVNLVSSDWTILRSHNDQMKWATKLASPFPMMCTHSKTVPLLVYSEKGVNSMTAGHSYVLEVPLP